MLAGLCMFFIAFILEACSRVLKSWKVWVLEESLLFLWPRSSERGKAGVPHFLLENIGWRRAQIAAVDKTGADIP